MLIERSSLVTATSGANMKNYQLSGVNSKVNENDVVVDKKAYELYEKIYKTYTNLNKYFQEIATEYRRCANKSVKGDKLVSSLKKVAKNCENQGKYCLNRQKNLQKYFKLSVTETGVKNLEEAVSTGVMSAGAATILARADKEGSEPLYKARSTTSSRSTSTSSRSTKSSSKSTKSSSKSSTSSRSTSTSSRTSTYKAPKASSSSRTSTYKAPKASSSSRSTYTAPKTSSSSRSTYTAPKTTYRPSTSYTSSRTSTR